MSKILLKKKNPRMKFAQNLITPELQRQNHIIHRKIRKIWKIPLHVKLPMHFTKNLKFQKKRIYI